MSNDSYVDSIAKVVLGILRRSDAIDFRAPYNATILFSDGDKATVRPDNAKLGESLADCEVRRPEGLTIVPTEGTRCILCWDGGDPSKRYILLGADASGAADTWNVEASTSVTLDAPETNAKHDLVSEHELGQSAGALSATLGVNVKSAKATGSDAEFDLELQPIDTSKLMGPVLSTVTFGREYATAPKAVLQVNEYGAAPNAYAVKYSTTTTSISLTGIFPPTTAKTVITVFVRGTK